MTPARLRAAPLRHRIRPLLAGDIDGVALAVLIFFFVVVTFGGFYAARWRKPSDMMSLDEWGLAGRGFGTGDHLVPARWRPLHGVHLRGGAGSHVRDRSGQRLLRRALHDRRLSARSSCSCRGCGPCPTPRATSRRPTSSTAATTRVASRWRSPSPEYSRRCPTSRLQLVGIAAVLDTIGLGGGQQLARQGHSAVRRLRGARGLHLLVGAARAGPDRVRQGHADLPGHRRGGRLGRRWTSGTATCSRRAKTKMETVTPAGHSHGCLHPDQHRRLLGLCVAGLRLGPCLVHVSALDDRGALRQEVAT